ncbi:hypothetical protein LTR86_007859 [Recurvomyces mirabilis]|nr:hypothetical protein LTR86_007859 [Recurvomyces mirabilis]
MLNAGFVLLPLYIWPTANSWQPLFDAAKAYPDVQFQVIVNPNDGPGTGCPSSDYATAMATLNSHSNIQALGYIHTANSWECGDSGSDICPCSRPTSDLEAEIATYQAWNVPGKCSNSDIHLTGIFYDEAPSDASSADYMSHLTTFAGETLTKGNTSLFNSGQSVDSIFYNIADYINTFESSGSAYTSQTNQGKNVGMINLQGTKKTQTTMIVNSFESGLAGMQTAVSQVLGQQKVAGLYVTDQPSYEAFPSEWLGFVELVSQTMGGGQKLKC